MGDLMKKHEMTEEDIKLQFITPAIEGAGWDRQKQIRMEYNFTDGRVIVRGNVTARGKRKRTDYLLYYKPNIPLAIVEAKDNRHSVGAGMQQAIEYNEATSILQIPMYPFIFFVVVGYVLLLLGQMMVIIRGFIGEEPTI